MSLTLVRSVLYPFTTLASKLCMVPIACFAHNSYDVRGATQVQKGFSEYVITNKVTSTPAWQKSYKHLLFTILHLEEVEVQPKERTSAYGWVGWAIFRASSRRI